MAEELPRRVEQGGKRPRRKRAPASRERDYTTLFEAMSEGFALCEPIWREGRLADYRVLEINPALQAMLGVGPEAAGTLLSEGGPIYPPWLEVCERALIKGKPMGFEYHNPQTGRWHEIRITRVRRDRMAQFFFDITERKEAADHQAHLFDELNHRVKNSLAMVSAILQMQAREAAPDASEALARAVARIEAIGEVHASLYAGSETREINLAAYLATLTERLQATLTEGERIRVRLDAEPAAIAVEKAAPIGMIVNELVTNAVKHGYGRHEAGEVRVSLERQPRGLDLTIADDGKGAQAGAAASGGLGMRLVSALARQLGGTLERAPGPGTTFKLSLAE